MIGIFFKSLNKENILTYIDINFHILVTKNPLHDVEGLFITLQSAYEAIVRRLKAGMRSSRVGLNCDLDVALACRLNLQKGQFSSLLETALPQSSQ